MAMPASNGSIRAILLGTTALLPAFAGGAFAQAPNAQPTGGRVVAGQAAITRSPGTTTVTQQSNRAVVDWQRFDVGRDQTVQFQQPNAGSWTLNRVTTPDPSQIAGRIQANGGVAIVNQSGIVFGQGSSVNVGALIASAANITNEAFMAGRMEFNGAPRPGARVENHGTVTVADRGLAVLAAPGVANTGTIRGRLARVALAGAETFALDMAGDGLLSIDVTQAVRQGGGALVTNSGTVEAPGGSVLLSAHAASGLVEDVVRQSGRVSANTDAATGRAGQVAIRGQGGAVRIEGMVEAAGQAPGTRGGRVEATGSAVTLAPGARIDASGTAGGGEVRLGGATTGAVRVDGQVAAIGSGATVRGGLVAVQAKDAVTIAAGAKLDASGGAGGGTVLVGTTGIGRDQSMAARSVVERAATIAADATVAGPGGTVAVNSTEATSVRGAISARGGAAGGDGGFVEVSGMAGIDLPGLSLLDVGAAAGRAGTILLDPQFIVISGGAVTGAQDNVAGTDNGDLTSAGPPPVFSSTLTVRAADIALNSGNLTLEATDGITVGENVVKALGSLTLRTTGDASTIAINRNVTVTSGTLTLAGGSVTLDAEIAAAGLAITARSGITQAGGLIRSASGVNTALTVTARTTASGDVSLARTTNGRLSFGTGGQSAGAVTLGGTSDITIGSALQAAGAVTVTSGRDIIVASTVSAGGAVGLTASRDISLRGALTATGQEVTLAAARDIGQTAAGVVTAARLSAVGQAGGGTMARSVALGTAENVVGTLAEMRAENSAIFRSTAALTVGVVTIRGNNDTLIEIQGNAGLTLTDGIRSNGQAVILRTGDSFDSPSGSGGIVQSGGLISTTWLSASAAGGTTLDQGANEVARLGRGRDASATAATQSLRAGGTATLVTGSDVEVFDPILAANASLRAPRIATRSGGTITVAGGGQVSLIADSLALGGRVAAPGGIIQVQTIASTRQVLLGGAPGGAETGALILNTDELALLGGSDSDAAARLRITARDSTMVEGPVALRGRIGVLQFDGAEAGYDLGGGAIDVGRLVVPGGAGDVLAENAGNRIDAVAIRGVGPATSQLRVVSGSATLSVVADTGPSGLTDGLSGFGSIRLEAPGLRLSAPVVAASPSGGSAVRLSATGAAGIRQDSTGPITATTLTVSAPAAGAAALLDAGGSASQASWNQVSNLGAVTAGGAFSLSNGAALAMGEDVAAKGDVTIRAPSLVQNAGAIATQGAGATVLLVSDALSLNGAAAVVATGGNTTVAFQPLSDNTGVTFNGAGGMTVSAAQVGQVVADNLSLRATGTGAVHLATSIDTGTGGLDLRGATVTQAAGTTVRAARISGSASSGDFTLAEAGNVFAAAGSITATAGSIRLATDGPLDLGGLSAGGAELSVAATALTVTGALSAGSSGTPGLVSLTAATGDIALGTAAVTAHGAGGTIRLSAAGAVTQTAGGAGAIGAALLDLVPLGLGTQSADLRGTGNAVRAIQSGLPGGLALTSGGALEVTGTGIAANADVSLRAGSIRVAAPIEAPGRVVSLRTDSGITQGTGARITARALAVRADAGSVLLDGGGAVPAVADRNAVQVLDSALVAERLVLRDAGSLDLAGPVETVAGGRMLGVTLDVLGAVSQSAGQLRTEALAFATDLLPASGVVLARAGNRIGAASGTAGGTVQLQTAVEAISLGPIEASRLAVTNADAAVNVTAAVTTTGTGVTLVGSSIGLGADVTAFGQAVQLTAGANGITQTAGRVAGLQLSLSTPGSVTLDNGNAALTTGLNQVGGFGTVAVGGDLVVRNQGNLPVGTLVAAGVGLPSRSVTLHSQDGNIIVGGGGAILADALTLTAPNGRVALPGSVTAANGIEIRANSVGLAGGLTNTTAGGILVSSVTNLVLGGDVAAPGQRVTLLADGSVSQPLGGITAAELRVRGIAPGSAAAGIDLAGGNAVGRVVEMRSSGDLRLRSLGPLSVEGAVAAGADGLLRLESSGVLTVASSASVTAGDPAVPTNGRVSLWGFGVRLEGPVTAGDSVTLFAAGGAMNFLGLPVASVAGATISQAASGAPITARRLVTIAPNTVDLTAGGNAVGTIAHFGIGGNDLVFTSTSPVLTIGGSPTVFSPGGETTTIAGLAGANGNVTLRAASVVIDQPVLAGNGATIEITSDRLAINALLSAPGGTVVLRQATAGHDWALGTGLASSATLISLPAAQLANLRTGTLRIAAGADRAILLGSMDFRTGSAATRAARVLDLSAGSITQQAGGEIAVERLTAVAPAGIRLDQGGAPTAAGNSINILGPLTASSGDIVILAGGIADGSGGMRPPAVDASGNPLSGTQPLRLDGAIGAGGVLTLRADGLDARGHALSAAGGEMTLGTFTAGVGLVLGAADPAQPGLRLESGVATGLSVTGGATPLLTLLAPGGDVQVAGAFDLTGADKPTRLAIRAGSASALAAGALSIADLDIVATAGGADLSPGSHAVETLRIVAAAGGDTGLTSTRDLRVLGVATAADGRVGGATLAGASLRLDGAVRADAVSLAATAPGATITQSALLEAGRLDLRTLGGDVTLADPANAISWLRAADLRNAALTAGGALRLVTATNLSLHRDGTEGVQAGTVALEAPRIGPAAADDPQEAWVRAIGTGAGPTTLELTAQRIFLDTGSLLEARGTGASDITIQAVSGFGIRGATLLAGTSIAINSGGFGVQDSRLEAPAIAVAAATGFEITGATIVGGSFRIGQTEWRGWMYGGSVSVTGDVTIDGGRSLRLEGVAIRAGGVVRLGGGTGLTLTDTTVEGAGIVVTSGLSLGITGAALTAAGNLQVTAGEVMQVADSTLNAGGLARLEGVEMRLTGSSLSAGTARLVGFTSAVRESSVTTAGTLDIQATGSQAEVSASTLRAGGVFTLQAAGSAALLGSDVSAAAIGLSARLGLRINPSRLVATGPGGITGDAGPGGALSLVSSDLSGAVVTLNGGTGATLTGGSVTSNGALGITTGGALTIDGTSLAGSPVTLLANGAASLRGATVSTPGDLTLQALGGFAISGSTLAAGRTLDVGGGGASGIAGTGISAETALFRTPGSLMAGGIQARIGSLLVLAGQGGIGSSGTITVAARAPAQRYPAVVFDTRSGAATSRLPFVVQPDTPGLASTQQATQMRAAPRSQAPGAFGTASDAPAGAMAFHLVAPDSPVFLLSAGGTITGDIVAARLGVHGTGGSATLFGTLAGRDGIATAEFGDLTRPIVPGALQQYRINGCVLSAINCVVLPPVMVVPSRLAADVAVALERQRARNPEVVVPDIAQEVF
jgi:filamentous hemagglutinin family protein